MCFAVGCQSSDDDVRITITTPEGPASHELAGAELTSALQDPVRLYHADGAATQSVARVFDATTFELPLPGDAGTFAATRTGRTLSGNTVAITWSADLTTLVVQTPESDHSILIEGLDDLRERELLVGKLALGFLGADTGAAALAKADGGLSIIVGIVAVSYITCITGGNAICGSVASDNCPNGVDEYKMICAAGYDVDDYFQFGMNCSFRCQ